MRRLTDSERAERLVDKLARVRRWEGQPADYAIRRALRAGILDGDRQSLWTCVAEVDEPGWLVDELVRGQAPLPVLREVLEAAWTSRHDDLSNHYMYARFDGRLTLTEALRAAAFPPPEDMPETVQVWRGTASEDASEAAMGRGWSLDRDVACWFAARRVPFGVRSRGEPVLLLFRTVRRQDILMSTNRRGEHEVVLAPQRSDPFDVVDDYEEILAGYHRYQQHRRQALAA